MSWIKRLLPSLSNSSSEKKKGVPEGLWTKCTACDAILFRAELERNLNVCPKCSQHQRLNARKRILLFLDEGTFEEIGLDIESVDRLKFKDSKRYKERISEAHRKTNEKEALVTGQGQLKGLNVVVSAFEFDYMGGSMGAGVGERFVQGVHAAINSKSPYICFSASGGARMQEGLFSLMQMAKTSAALAMLAKVPLPYISVLTDPTTGGVSASLALLGDIIIAEPKALIGFTGPRVIEQTVREKLPEGFQRSEFLLEHGAIDMILDRREMRDRIANLLAKLMHKDRG